jgi:hypothetical protein
LIFIILLNLQVLVIRKKELRLVALVDSICKHFLNWWLCNFLHFQAWKQLAEVGRRCCGNNRVAILKRVCFVQGDFMEGVLFGLSWERHRWTLGSHWQTLGPSHHKSKQHFGKSFSLVFITHII